MHDFTWNPEWDTGNAEIDRQHRELLDRMAKLSDAIALGGTSGEAERALLFFAEYVTFHFQSEEELMAAHQYPDLARHRDIHTDLRMSVNAIVEKHLDGEQPIRKDLLEFFISWLVEHLSSEDRQLGLFLAEHPK